MAQKRRVGQVILNQSKTPNSRSGLLIHHNIATRGGDSGSPIIDLASNKLIGVHHTNLTEKATNRLMGGEFNGPGLDRILKSAIRDCLDWERNNMI